MDSDGKDPRTPRVEPPFGEEYRPYMTVDEADGLPTELMKINMGPSHPAMHGTIHMVLALDGEKVRNAEINMGYMHRCFEKESEYATYDQIFPYTDRLNYVSPLINNVGYAMTVEKALGLTERIPRRAELIRIIVSELSRVTDHLTCDGATAMELGAFTSFLWMIKAREWLYEMLEKITGARLTHTYVRMGGVCADLPTGWIEEIPGVLDRVEKTMAEADGLLRQNRIFRERMENVGVMSQADAISDGWTGPCLRSTGVDYDVRKDQPYSLYNEFEFDVPVGTRGDNFDRYACRLHEALESMKIVRQALKKLEPGPVLLPDYRVTLPPKAEVYNTIEGMIAHFKLVMDGIRVPAGEVYQAVEGGNGELGFFLVSDGSGRPFKLHCRAPCLYTLYSIPRQIYGGLISDVIPTFGMCNYIAGECER